MVKYNVQPHKDKRFKPGQSGNPGGRPKKAKQQGGSQNEITEFLDGKISYTENGRIKKMSLRRALLQSASRDGFKGSSKLAIDLLRLELAARKLEGPTRTPENIAELEIQDEQRRQSIDNIIGVLESIGDDNSAERYKHIESLCGYQVSAWFEANRSLLRGWPENIERSLQALKRLEAEHKQAREARKNGYQPKDLMLQEKGHFTQLAEEAEAALRDDQI